MSEWTSVTKGHRLCRNGVNITPAFVTDCPTERDERHFHQSFRKCRRDLLQSEAFSHLTDSVTKVLGDICGNGDLSQVELICYGIGNFGRSPAALYQLALVTEWEKKKLFSRAKFFDPQLTEGEKKYLRGQNFSVMEENEKGLRGVVSPTLFFMPHCGRPLYNNLLYANWSPQQLGKMAIIGNSFQQLSSEYGSRMPYIHQSTQFTVELPLPFGQDDLDFAFSFMSLHSFPLQHCHRANVDWSQRPTPVYEPSDETEVI